MKPPTQLQIDVLAGMLLDEPRATTCTRLGIRAQTYSRTLTGLEDRGLLKPKRNWMDDSVPAAWLKKLHAATKAGTCD